MTIANQDDYIKYRFHRAEESFEEAIILPRMRDGMPWLIDCIMRVFMQ